MINFRNAKFITSMAENGQNEVKNIPEVLFVGRSNCGKSSLINSLVQNKNLAFTSSKPGHTRLLNYFEIDNKFYLVDAPGYGFAKGTKDNFVYFGKLMEGYFNNNKNISLVLLLLDGRRIPNEDDVYIYNFLKKENIRFKICVTKVDKLNQSEKAAVLKNFASAGVEISTEQAFFTSSLKTISLEPLKEFITNIIEK